MGLTEKTHRRLEGWIDALDDRPRSQRLRASEDACLPPRHTWHATYAAGQRRILDLAEESYVETPTSSLPQRLNDYLFILAAISILSDVDEIPGTRD